MTPLQAALKLHDLGANVTAIPEGKKEPAHKWKKLEAVRMPREAVRTLTKWDSPGGWYRGEEYPPIGTVGIVNGIASWRTIDVDAAKVNDVKQPVPVKVLDTLLGALGLPITYPWAGSSRSGKGFHVHVRCEGELPEQIRLAAKKDEPGVMTLHPAANFAGLFDHVELRWERCQTVLPSPMGYEGNGIPSEPPALVDVDRVVAALLAIAEPAKPNEVKTARATAKPTAATAKIAAPVQQGSHGKITQQTLDAIHSRFDCVAWFTAELNADTDEEPNGDIRILGHTGLIVTKHKTGWYVFGEDRGGSWKDAVAYTRNLDVQNDFREIALIAADFLKITVAYDEPDATANRTNGRYDEAGTRVALWVPASSGSFRELPTWANVTDEAAANASPWLDAYLNYSRVWSPRSYDGFHTASALWLLSTIAARRVAFDLGSRRFTNLYIALCSRTSLYAKTSAVKIAGDLLERAGLSFLLLPSESTPAAFLRGLAGRVPDSWEVLPEEQQRTVLLKLAFAGQRGWQYDEFGQKIAAMLKDGGIMADFRGILRRLDDTPDYFEYETISRGLERVDRPYLSLFAALTPADLAPFARKGSALWGDGFLARFILVTPPSDALPNRERFPVGTRVPPAELVTTLRNWHERLGTPRATVNPRPTDDKRQKATYDIEVTPRDPQVCQFGNAVRDRFYAYHDALTELAAQSEQQDLDGSYTRNAERAFRVAALLASLENDGVIEERHWARAQQIAEQWRRELHNLVDALATQEVQTRSASVEDKILRVLGRGGDHTAREVAQFAHVSSQEALACLSTLVNLGEVDVQPAGRTNRYSLLQREKQHAA
ncbi:DUF3987 domain-containing protein [Candidatus Chloroploca sp. M-50]|uniref:DUF3987 domain-containing protein n=1 Tax=Candidatus Chloroploca mongolica TaxID=2528176 RepID=A0ABS4DDX7_9CHLR|nr:DUF3987 domain-containing protein [Candidatus Chloroploca mongolica]MBP1467637.1 DUF3987 domain-containing protein [Candidatus Chloroploca mongolica]